MTIQTQKIKDDRKIFPEIEYWGQNGHTVFRRVYPDGIAEPLPLEPSLKLRDHSPTGFSFGYNGAGPSQLSLALLLDATLDPERAQNYYQDFTWDIVAGWGSEWSIKRSEILAWLKNMEARELEERQTKN